MIFSTTRLERKILYILALLLALGWLAYWLF
jgi:hypothetical protein